LTVCSEALRSILCAPGSGSELSPGDEALVGPDGSRFAIVSGIPILLPPGDRRGRREIIEASRERSSTYYQSNYAAGGNPQRERRQALVVALLSSLARPGTTVLDVGAGPAVLAEPARALGLEYVALDLSLANLLAGRGRVSQLDALVADAVAIPVKPDAVDGVVAVGSLEYVPEITRAVAELCRVVRPGGFVIASFANARSPRRWWDELVVRRAIGLRATMRRERGRTYRRYLSNANAVVSLFARCGAEVRGVQYLTPGLAGYPLSELRVVRGIDEALTARLPRLVQRRSEFVVVARKAAPA
jgi:2-polyprenyl-6-hydroxyphenyl methylase/3-demethylubiquinone-9 3-methyltransferase